MASYTPNLNLYKPDDSDNYEDFREGFNENMDKLDQGGGGNQNIAEEYDDTATYAVGDYVIYDGLLYKCDTAVTTAETFDPTKWTHVVVTDEMGSGGGGSGSLDAVETTSNAYALLPQADKEDPTKIYFLNDTQSSVVDTPIDQSTFVLKIENQSQMNVAVNNGKLVSVYNYGSSIGACAFEPNAISETASKIKFKFTTLGSYDTAQSHAITIGVKANYQSSNWIFSTDADWIVKKVYDTRNTSVDDYIDISGITTPCYLMICFHGWTVTFDEFLVEDVSVPTGDTEIRYKDVPYGNNGGESGGNYYLNTLYSTEEKKIGYWTDGKPLYQKTLVINNLNLNTSGTAVDITSLGVDMCCPVYEGSYYIVSGVKRGFARLEYQQPNEVYLYPAVNRTGTTCFITLQYTKTTDTPELNPQTGGVIYLPTIYSEEEREVGVWRDGKPLYQITVDQTIGSDADYTVFANGIDHAHLVNSCIEYSSGRWMSFDYISLGTTSNSRTCYVDVQNGALKLHNQTNQSSHWIATIQYTKTADVAGSGDWTPSGELAHHYSTNEQVIGTWIDGKPLYEKTIAYTPSGTISSNTTIANVPNAKVMRATEATAYNPSDNRGYVLPNVRANGGTKITYDNGDVTLVIIGDSWSSSWTFYVTVQYTKTTDT